MNKSFENTQIPLQYGLRFSVVSPQTVIIVCSSLKGGWVLIKERHHRYWQALIMCSVNKHSKTKFQRAKEREDLIILISHSTNAIIYQISYRISVLFFYFYSCPLNTSTNQSCSEKSSRKLSQLSTNPFHKNKTNRR